MSLFSALNSAVSGLQAQSAAISSVSQNIANASTTAYKTSEIDFQSLVTGNTTSTGYSSGGVVFSSRIDASSQGQIQSTDSGTDIAINGKGYFVVSDAVDNQPSGYNYSRNGSFSTDANGYLVNSEGYYLLGQKTDQNGNVTATNSNDLNSLTPVNTTDISGSAKATTKVSLQANLPADANTGDSYTTAFEIYDSLGVSQTINETWTKTAANTWTLGLSNPVYTSDSTVTSGTLSPSSIDITFNGDGTLASTNPSPITVSITGYTTGANDQNFTLDLGTAGNKDGLTQYTSTSTNPSVDITKVDQDGVRYGKLSSISIADSGLVTAKFDNGLSQPIYQIPIATFANPAGLTHINGTVFDENEAAGNYNLHDPKEGDAGAIVSSALEQSTTDTSAEFDKMIVAQQAYSASAKVISTTNDMFTTLMNAIR